MYGATWILTTLIVECLMVGYINHTISLYGLKVDTGNKDVDSLVMQKTSFNIQEVYYLWMTVTLFSLFTPACMYLYIRMGLLSADIKFMKSFAIYGYSCISYLPAVALTLIPVPMLKWIFVGLALVN